MLTCSALAEFVASMRVFYWLPAGRDSLQSLCVKFAGPFSGVRQNLGPDAYLAKELRFQGQTVFSTRRNTDRKALYWTGNGDARSVCSAPKNVTIRILESLQTAFHDLSEFKST